MRWIGTDSVALACILGGAAIAGGFTMALAEDERHVDFGCSTVLIEGAPRVAVVSASVAGQTSSIVVTPSSDVLADCAVTGQVELRHGERARRSLERARRNEARALRRAERLETEMERLEERLAPLGEVEFELQGLEELLELEEWEFEFELQLEPLLERLERIGDERGG